MFVFGTQYLRGFTPERDQWEQDMAHMKALGFNTIRAWLVWNAIERKEGVLDTRYITDFLDCAERHGLRVGLLFHLHAAPAWAIEKYPQYFYETAQGLPFEPADRPNTPSGGWPGLCFDHDEVRAMEERFIRGVIAVTKNYENVAFYEPMNEPHQWIDPTVSPYGFFCFCPASIRKFQGWLEAKYQTIEALNQAWGHFYESFRQVRPTRWLASYGDLIDFRQFTVDNIAEEISFRTNLIRECDNKPVLAHAWGGSAVTCPLLGGMAFDDWKNARIFDKWGYSAFPRKTEDLCALGLGSDATRCAAGGKEFWQSELSAGITGGILQQIGRMDDGLFDQFNLESLRHGARGLLYWQFRRERIGTELGGYAMTDYDGGDTNLTRRAAKLGKMLQQNSALFNTAEPQKAQVGLIFSIRSYFADWAANEKASNKYAVDSMSGYYKMFWEENIPVDILHEELHGDLSQYKLIVVPNPIALSPAMAERLKEFVHAGGTVLSDPMFGLMDGDFKCSYQVPGFGFAEIFGAHEENLLRRKELTLSDGKKDFVFEGNRFAETFRDLTATTLYRYEDGTPAILSNRYGAGNALLSGINLGLTYSSRRLLADDIRTDDSANCSTAAKEIVLRIAAEAGIAPNGCDAPTVQYSLLHTESGALLYLINIASAEKSGSIRLDSGYQTADDLYAGIPLALESDRLRFTLAPNQSTVIKLT